MEIVDVATIFAEHSHRIREIVPRADLHLTGSASVPNLDANDIDLVALVDDVGAAAAGLRGIYEPLYADHWSADWAAFRDPGPPQVDVVLTRYGTEWDARHRLSWDLIRRDRDLQAEYAQIKSAPSRYQEQKAEFFDRIVARLVSP